MKKLVIIGLIIGVIALAGCGKEKVSYSEEDGIFFQKIGKFEVYTLIEAERDGNAGILVNADQEILDKFIPADGFRHTANAFLVKANGKNIMIDAGTGVNGILIDRIKKIGVEPEDIDIVLITHLHGDHFGGLQRDGVANFPNATVYMNEIELEYFTEINVNQAAIAALTLYESKIDIFCLHAGEFELFPGITPIAAYGHTPGHTLYQIENGKDKLLIIGDLLHVALVQFAIPEISATLDIDPIEAAQTRRQVLSYAASNNIPVGGMHIVYPGVGAVETDESGFKFIPF